MGWTLHFTLVEGPLPEAYRRSPSRPVVVNLRMDPFERGYFESLFYMRWMADQMWTYMPAQAIGTKFLATFKEFPQRQPIGSLSIEGVLERLQSGAQD